MEFCDRSVFGNLLDGLFFPHFFLLCSFLSHFFLKWLLYFPAKHVFVFMFFLAFNHSCTSLVKEESRFDFQTPWSTIFSSWSFFFVAFYDNLILWLSKNGVTHINVTNWFCFLIGLVYYFALKGPSCDLWVFLELRFKLWVLVGVRVGKVRPVKAVPMSQWLSEMWYLSSFAVAHGGQHRWMNFRACWFL